MSTDLNTQWGPWIISDSKDKPETAHLPYFIRMQAIYINFKGELRNDAEEGYDRSPHNHAWGRGSKTGTLAYRWEVMQNDNPACDQLYDFRPLDLIPSGDPNPFEFLEQTVDEAYCAEYEFTLGLVSLAIATLYQCKIDHVWTGEFRMRRHVEDAFDFAIPMTTQQVCDFRELLP
jgi:hypothetical protein